jgi:hypothetical protein
MRQYGIHPDCCGAIVNIPLALRQQERYGASRETARHSPNGGLAVVISASFVTSGDQLGLWPTFYRYLQLTSDDRPWGGSQPPAVVYSYAPGGGISTMVSSHLKGSEAPAGKTMTASTCSAAEMGRLSYHITRHLFC